ncbi:hypothetical protein D3C71_2124190 [compost metagenome]
MVQPKINSGKNREGLLRLLNIIAENNVYNTHFLVFFYLGFEVKNHFSEHLKHVTLII